MKYGWLPDIPDQRDRMFFAARPVMFKLPPCVDLRRIMPPIYNQLELGSCTANASCAAVQYSKWRWQEINFQPSRLFNYFCTRKLKGTEGFDAGGYIRDSIKSHAKWGVCLEGTWPYDISRFAEAPPNDAFIEAEKNQALKYFRLPHRLNQIKARLSMDYPVVFGFSVYESFESEEVFKTGELQMPGPNERMIGGHAVLCVGYDDKTERFLIRNSYGEEFGMKGYFTMPYEYLQDQNLAADFWTIELTE